MTNEEKIYKLFVKVLTSTNTNLEKEELNQLITENKKLDKKFKLIKYFWDNYFYQPSSNTIIKKTEEKLGFKRTNIKNRLLKPALKIAASILLIVILGFGFQYVVLQKNQVSLNEYVSKPGEQKEIVLSDGTKVWLNNASMIIASEPFVGKTREVKLFGEAYFEVAHNHEKPFIVHTPFLKTQVLGTKFNITALSPEARQEIALYEGKVELISKINHNKKVILTPGERAYYIPENGQIRVTRTDLGRPAQWRDGILRFYDEDFFSISKKLERKFQTRIFIADSVVGKLRFTAEFDVESLDKILDLLNEAHKFRFKETENGIIIQKAKT